MNTSVLSTLGQRWRELLGFALIFRLVESLFFAPAAGIAGKWLLGRTVLDSTAVVSFLLSPRGILACVFGATALLTVRLLEHAGLSTIFFGAFGGQRVSAFEAAHIVSRYLLVLLRVSVRFVGLGLLLIVPLLTVAGGLAGWLLPRHDVNYYLKLRPPEFMVAAAGIGTAAVITAALAVALVALWRWVVQAVIFEQKKAPDAFARSAALSRSIRWKLAGATMAVWAFSLGMGLL